MVLGYSCTHPTETTVYDTTILYFLFFRTSFLDQEWFSFETSGTLVVGWEGGPSRQFTRQEPLRPGVNKGHLIPGSVASKERDIRSTGIEIAAAAATGMF